MKKYLVMFMFCMLMATSNNAFASVATSTENLVEADGWMDGKGYAICRR